MKKITFLFAIFIAQILYCSVAFASKKKSSKSHEIEYAKMKKDRENVEKAIKDSGEDCIDNVISLLSELEQEQNAKQSIQQSETACQLELQKQKKEIEESAEFKLAQKQRDECFEDERKLESTNKQLEKDLKESQVRITTERNETQKALDENTGLKKDLALERESTKTLKKSNEDLQNLFNQKDATIKDLKEQLQKNESLIGQKEREYKDLNATYLQKKKEWEKEQGKFQKTPADYSELEEKIKDLNASLIEANAKAKRIPKLEEDLKLLVDQNTKLQKEVADEKDLKKEKDKEIEKLNLQIAKYKTKPVTTMAQELSQVNKESSEKNKSYIEQVKKQMEGLTGTLTQIQKLLPGSK